MSDADSSGSGSIPVQIIILLILILINAFFAMAEMSMVSANRIKIKTMAESGSKKALRLASLIDHPNTFLSTIQVCITLAGFLQSAFAATTMAREFASVIDSIGIKYGLEIAVILITVILSFFNLVLGELVPKRIALQFPDRIALSLSGTISFISVLMKPFVALLSKSVALVLRVFGIKEDRLKEVYSEEEIKSHLDVGIESGEIDESGADMIASVFEFDDKLAYEIMTPRTDVFMKSINEPLVDYVDELIKSRYSRIPFFDKDNDDVVGVLYMKDFYINAKKNGFNRVNIKKLLRKPFFVPESKNIDELFREMQQEKKEHLAFLVDEYGGISGIVTIEDMVEEVMGNIDDEYDDYEPKIERLDNNRYEIEGNYYLDDLNEVLEDDGHEDIKIESDEFETIGGFLTDRLGEISDDDELMQVVEYNGCIFTVMSWKERRIEKLIMEIPAILSTNTASEEYER